MSRSILEYSKFLTFVQGKFRNSYLRTNTKKGTAVLVASKSQLQTGGKLASRQGTKGVVRIIPDDEMPMTDDGMVADAVILPVSTVKRGNPAMMAELALGKIAGQIYRVPDFEEIEDIPEFVEQELQKYGVSPDSPIVDRKTGKKIHNGDGSGIANGSMWQINPPIFLR
ncbi:MAG: hypothetical protein FWH27_17550 [Planctomycetaceae bacterium]|nr:hypothetical protein [Planctomycetaceae bacterium]